MSPGNDVQRPEKRWAQELSWVERTSQAAFRCGSERDFSSSHHPSIPLNQNSPPRSMIIAHKKGKKRKKRSRRKKVPNVTEMPADDFPIHSSKKTTNERSVSPHSITGECVKEGSQLSLPSASGPSDLPATCSRVIPSAAAPIRCVHT